jgi:hypothetical protein
LNNSRKGSTNIEQKAFDDAFTLTGVGDLGMKLQPIVGTGLIGDRGQPAE